MLTRRIGSLDVSVVGLGCNNFGGRLDAAATDTVVHAALDAGITFFDTADIYGATHSEELLGRALGTRRHEVVLATKFGMEIDANHVGAKPDYARRALEDSLRRLGTDHVDLYQLHRPDDSVPIEDTLGALDALVKAGKVREIGCSNFNPPHLRDAAAAASHLHGARFVSVQNEYSLLHREPEKGGLAECERLDLAFIPFFPLASGLLTGKYRRGQPVPQGTRIASGSYSKLLTDDNIEKVEALSRFAQGRDHTLLELAFGWLLSHRVVASVIAGATSAGQVQQNANAAGWQLTDEERSEASRLVPLAP